VSRLPNEIGYLRTYVPVDNLYKILKIIWANRRHLLCHIQLSIRVTSYLNFHNRLRAGELRLHCATVNCGCELRM
jgi:hypothetical protein